MLDLDSSARLLESASTRASCFPEAAKKRKNEEEEAAASAKKAKIELPGDKPHKFEAAPHVVKLSVGVASWEKAGFFQTSRSPTRNLNTF